MAQLQGKSTLESLSWNSLVPYEHTQGYLPVKGLEGLKLVQDFN